MREGEKGRSLACVNASFAIIRFAAALVYSYTLHQRTITPIESLIEA